MSICQDVYPIIASIIACTPWTLHARSVYEIYTTTIAVLKTDVQILQDTG